MGVDGGCWLQYDGVEAEWVGIDTEWNMLMLMGVVLAAGMKNLLWGPGGSSTTIEDASQPQNIDTLPC